MAPRYSSWLTSAATIFLIWSILLFIVRTWAKRRPGQQWLLYDNVIVASMVAGIGQVVALYVAISKDYGHPPESINKQGLSSLQKALYASQLLYVVSFGLSRLSAAFFVKDLARSKLQKHLALATSILTTIWTAVCVLLIAIRGKITEPWSTMEGSSTLYIRWLVVEYSGIVLEIFLWILCVSLVWGLNMAIMKRISVLLVFGCRMALIPVVVIRLHYLDPNSSANVLRNMTLADIITEAAMQYSIMACCITCLKPFLTPFAPGFGYSNGGYTSNGYGVDSYPDPTSTTQSSYADHKIAKPTRSFSRHNTKRVRQSRLADDNHKLRPERGIFTTSAWGEQEHGSARSENDDIELLAHSEAPATIQQTKTFTIVEERL